jgi:hypothetical protein
MKTMNQHCGRFQSTENRRDFLKKAGAGFGMTALAGLMAKNDLLADESIPDPLHPMIPRAGHFPAKAKAVIWLFMEGAPSAVDMFDPKPELTRRDGQTMEIDVFNGNPGPLMKSPFQFQRYGQTGSWVCEHYPNVAKHVDDFAFINSFYSESNDHVPALYQINTGIPRPGFPSAGSWITYGLGSENSNLPGYVVLGNNRGVKGGNLNWSSAFLLTTYQGTLFLPEGAPVINLTRPQEIKQQDQRAQLDLMSKLNRRHMQSRPGEDALLGRIQSFELAYRMQTEASDLVDLEQETAATREMYGVDDKVTRSYGRKCLMARRLVERGVRFVQVYSDGEWDAHSNLNGNHKGHCRATDKPIHALLTDLKRTGLIDDTLVIWGGEFGRMPVSQGNGGRDHNPQGFGMFMTGAGIRPGTRYGELDDIGYRSVVDRVSVHDLHATMLHLLGMDHERLTYLHNGRRYRLTDVAGEVIRPILA